MELLAGGLAEKLVEGVVVEFTAPAFLVLAQDFVFCGGEDAVKPAKDGHGEHYALVLRGAIRAPEQIGNLPDKIR
jgi:hypothetical protein